MCHLSLEGDHTAEWLFSIGQKHRHSRSSVLFLNLAGVQLRKQNDLPRVVNAWTGQRLQFQCMRQRVHHTSHAPEVFVLNLHKLVKLCLAVKDIVRWRSLLNSPSSVYSSLVLGHDPLQLSVGLWKENWVGYVPGRGRQPSRWAPGTVTYSYSHLSAVPSVECGVGLVTCF